MCEDQNEIDAIKVHWYNTRSKNAFTWKYILEMLECARSRDNRKRKRNMCITSTMNINEVDIIVYGFTLIKVVRLRKLTVHIIKEKLHVFQGVSGRRRTRLATHELESHDFILDKDNASVRTCEDEEDQSSLYISHSSES